METRIEGGKKQVWGGGGRDNKITTSSRNKDMGKLRWVRKHDVQARLRRNA